ncbi:MAG: hypothetical protein RR385_08465 [Clostridiales bacterium]
MVYFLSLIAAGFFGIGSYLFLAHFAKLPTIAHSRSVMTAIKWTPISRQENGFTALISLIADKIALIVPLDKYKKRMLQVTLDSSGITCSPEKYVALIWVKTAMVMLLIIPAALFAPILVPVVIICAGLYYYKERFQASKKIQLRQEDIGKELVRFTNFLAQQFKQTTDVYTILQSYMPTARPTLKEELTILLADMGSGSSHTALRRFESKINIQQISQIVRGLVMAVDGNQPQQYFSILYQNFTEQERQRLRIEAQKRPPKVGKYCAAILVCFIATYLVIIGMEILKNIQNIF